MTSFILTGIPDKLTWQGAPLAWYSEAASALTIVAGAQTDWFVDPDGTTAKTNAPVALFTPPDTSFRLCAKVTVDFAATFDAGVLQIHAGPERWAKLCFELSPQGHPMVVSVVTRGVSDDCNSAVIAGNTVHLRITQIGQTTAFHYSEDGHYWRLVRYFSLYARRTMATKNGLAIRRSKSFSKLHWRSFLIRVTNHCFDFSDRFCAKMGSRMTSCLT